MKIACMLLAACLALSPAVFAAGPSPQLPSIMSAKDQEAVDKGLAYLAKMQQPDGSLLAQWNGSSYHATMTSLAGLAFMASGSTPQEGPYAENVKKAMVYLLDLAESRDDGLIAGPDEKRSTYGHGLAMLFLAQCYGMEHTTEHEARIKKALDKAIALLYKGQSPHGGWLYNPAGGGDEGSTTGIVLQGLRACRNVGIKVPKDMIDKSVGYLRLTQNDDGGIAYSMAFKGASRPPLAAQALACLYAAGVYDRQAGGVGPEAKLADRLRRYLRNLGPYDSAVEGFFFYHNLFLSEAAYQRSGYDRSASKEWETHYKTVAKSLLEKQTPTGSWIGDGVGPVFATSCACIILQLPYGYLPICAK